MTCGHATPLDPQGPCLHHSGSVPQAHHGTSREGTCCLIRLNRWFTFSAQRKKNAFTSVFVL